jgi:hypothetical protein
MKHILFLLLFLPVLAYAQFPANPNKIRLGNQTTADGLVVRTAAPPSWTPSSINNAWLAFDTVAVKLYYYDAGMWNEYTGGNFATNNLTFTGNRVHNLSTRTLTIADGGTYPTFQQSAATDGFTLASSATDLIAQTPGLLQIENSDTITITADRIRMNAADTRIQQVSKNNALNRVMMLDSLTGQVYYRDVSSIAGGGGTVTGTGTTNTLPKWTSSTALGNSLITDDGTNVAVGGTASFRLPNGTTAQRPGTPLAGMTRYNTTSGTMEYYGASAWEVPAKSASATGLGTATRVPFADANGRLTDIAGFTFTSGTGHLFIPSRLNVGGTTPTWAISNFTMAESAGLPWKNNASLLGLTNTSGNGAYKTISFGNASQALALISSQQVTSTTGDLRFYTIGTFADPPDLYINPSGSVGIQNLSPARTLHVTGEARITDLTTDTPTRIVGADADGDLGSITVGSGLSLSAGTLSATGGAGTTNLAFSGASSPVTLTSDTGTDVIFAAGSGLALSQSGGTATYSRTYSLTHITISGGSTFFWTTAERPDNDTPGSAAASVVGSDFSVSGSTINYTGAGGALLRVEGSISFSVADDGDYYVSMYKEGTEIGATSMRVSCVAGNYYSISLPATTTSGSTNDTFDLRIATVSGNSTTTMHRYGFIIERIY